MKTVKFITVCVAAILLAAPIQNASAQTSSKFTNVVSALTSESGINAGSALLGLYTQFKADGKLDFKNANNIANILKLASNISGLKNGTAQTSTSKASSGLGSYVSGLISGSNNLVNNSNSGNVLNTLSSLANLNLSSIGSTTATATASGLLSKLGGSKVQQSSATDNSATTQQATSLLSGLFSTFAK